MSSSRAEVIERSYRAFREDDVDALLALYEPDAVWDFSNWEGFPDAPTYSGRDSVGSVLRMLRDVFGELEISPTDVVDAGDDLVFVEGTIRVRGRASGVEVGAPPYAQLIRFRGERILRIDNYTDVEAARRAAGLAED